MGIFLNLGNPVAKARLMVSCKFAFALVLSCLALSSFAKSEPENVSEPILCDLNEAKTVVKTLVAEEGEATFKDSLKAVGSRMRADLQQVLNDDETASFTEWEAVEEVIKKSSCIVELVVGTALSDEFRAKMKAYEMDIRNKSAKRFLKLPARARTEQVANLKFSTDLIYFNRETVSLMFAIFEGGGVALEAEPKNNKTPNNPPKNVSGKSVNGSFTQPPRKK